jgi:type VI secretion system protein ImpK
MSLEHWKNILETYDRVQALLKKHLPVRPAGAKEKDKAPRRGPEDLQELQSAIVEELVELQRELIPRKEFSEEHWTSERVLDVIRPLSYLFDETVLLRLSEAEQAIWPLVQKRLFLVDAGGDHFYEFADEKLGRSDTPSLVFEVLHFCLSAGFQGNLELWPARVEDYKKKLAERIPKPEPTPAPAPPPSTEAPQPYEFPLRYYLAAGFVIVCLPMVLWVLSN